MEVVVIDQETKEEAEEKRAEDSTNIEVNLHVLRRIYKLESWEELVSREKLFKKVLLNGYYKSAVCDQLKINYMEITVDGVTHIFSALPDTVGNIITLVKGEHPKRILPIDVDLVDKVESV